MKFFRVIVLCLLALTSLSPALRAEREDVELIFASLHDNAPLRATFAEARFHPFRAVPIKLSGELRLDPAHGLSLHYVEPEETTLIVDDRGLLMRDARGRERVAPPDHRAQDSTRALLQLMRFDYRALLADFTLQDTYADGGWTFTFTPRDTDLSASLGTISVSGQADRVNTIVMAKSPRQRVEITVTDATPRAEFTADEIARYFR